MNKHTPKRQPRQLSDGTIEIPLTKGYIAVIDEIDLILTARTWSAVETISGHVYASNSLTLNHIHKPHYLHRVIGERMYNYDDMDNFLIDHRDGNSLNNTRGNIRLATVSQNKCNSKRPISNTTGYKGVHKIGNIWRAMIWVNDANIIIGYYKTPEEAHEAYKEAAVKYFGEFARFE